jgi:hypothetical protein
MMILNRICFFINGLRNVVFSQFAHIANTNDHKIDKSDLQPDIISSHSIEKYRFLRIMIFSCNNTLESFRVTKFQRR